MSAWTIDVQKDGRILISVDTTKLVDSKAYLLFDPKMHVGKDKKAA